jgi:hypothetical protein
VKICNGEAFNLFGRDARFLCAVFICCTYLCMLAVVALADPIQVQSELQQQLDAKGMVSKNRTVKAPCPPPNLRPGQSWWCDSNLPTYITETYQDYLLITGLSVTKVGNITFGKPIINAIPEKIHMQTFELRNCSSVSQSGSDTVSLSIATQNTVSMSHSVSTSITIGANLSYSIPAFGSASINFSVNRTVQLSDSSSQTQSETVTHSETIPRMAAAYTDLWGEYFSVESNLSVPFSANIIFDGTVDANISGYSKLSQILDETQRTFIVSGILSATAASDAHTRFYEKSLDKIKDCASGEAVSNKVLNGSARLLSSIALEGNPPGSPSAIPQMNLSDPKTFLSQFSASPRFVTGDESRMSTKLNLLPQNTPSFTASGQHQCQSGSDIGHTCQVNGVGFGDCDIAKNALQVDDCCPSTSVCGPDPSSGTVQCTLGGTSIGFVMQYCLPM